MDRKSKWRPPQHFPYQEGQERKRRIYRPIHSRDRRSLSHFKPLSIIQKNDRGLVKDGRLIGCHVCGRAMRSPLLPGQSGSCCLNHFQQFRPVSCSEERFNWERSKDPIVRYRKYPIVRRMNGKRSK